MNRIRQVLAITACSFSVVVGRAAAQDPTAVAERLYEMMTAEQELIRSGWTCPAGGAHLKTIYEAKRVVAERYLSLERRNDRISQLGTALADLKRQCPSAWRSGADATIEMSRPTIVRLGVKSSSVPVLVLAASIMSNSERTEFVAALPDDLRAELNEWESQNADQVSELKLYFDGVLIEKRFSDATRGVRDAVKAFTGVTPHISKVKELENLDLTVDKALQDLRKTNNIIKP